MGGWEEGSLSLYFRKKKEKGVNLLYSEVNKGAKEMERLSPLRFEMLSAVKLASARGLC